MYVLAAKLVRKLMNIMLHEATDHEHTIVTNNRISRNRHSEAAALHVQDDTVMGASRLHQMD